MWLITCHIPILGGVAYYLKLYRDHSVIHLCQENCIEWIFVIAQIFDLRLLLVSKESNPKNINQYKRKGNLSSSLESPPPPPMRIFVVVSQQWNRFCPQCISIINLHCIFGGGVSFYIFPPPRKGCQFLAQQRTPCIWGLSVKDDRLLVLLYCLIFFGMTSGRAVQQNIFIVPVWRLFMKTTCCLSF